MARMLEIIDRDTGEVERIHEDDANFKASIALAAEKAGISFNATWKILDYGGAIATPGFMRRLVEAD